MTQPLLTPSTIVPTNQDLFVAYLIQLYEDIASAVNSKDPIFYPMAISDVATNIVSLPNFGAYIICISGIDPTLPTITASLCKASKTAAGQVDMIGQQAGTAAWAGNVLTITSTTTNFQVAHDRAGVTGNFNIKWIGTQGF